MLLQNEIIILENTRVRLEPVLSANDCEKVASIALTETELLKYSPSSIHTKYDLLQYFEIALKAKQQGTVYPFLIFDKSQKKYAGSTRFGNISLQNQRLEIGWTWLGKAFQGTGLNQNIKSLMLSYAFNDLNCERVEFKADGRNIQSRRAMEKIGATYEGCLRSHTLMKDGFRRDTVYYSILREEFLK